MDDIDRKREQLKNVYPGAKGWAKKVDKMSPTQVIAVYTRLSSQRKLGR